MATMTHTVTLSPDLSSKVDILIADGKFASPDTAVDYLLSMVLEEELVAPYSAGVLVELDRGAEEVRRGEFVSQEEVEAFFDDWRRNG
jgi:predicted transcriptional regulator